MKQVNEYELCLNLAQRILSLREHSISELMYKLQARNYSNDIIEHAITHLLATKQLDEQRFTESYIRHRCSKGFGSMKIGYELQQKGVKKELIEMALQNCDIDWNELCQQQLQKKLASASMTKQKLTSLQLFLRQRGFNGDQIRNVCKSYRCK